MIHVAETLAIPDEKLNETLPCGEPRFRTRWPGRGSFLVVKDTTNGFRNPWPAHAASAPTGHSASGVSTFFGPPRGWSLDSYYPASGTLLKRESGSRHGLP